jgi:hypothetical protein
MPVIVTRSLGQMLSQARFFSDPNLNRNLNLFVG